MIVFHPFFNLLYLNVFILTKNTVKIGKNVWQTTVYQFSMIILYIFLINVFNKMSVEFFICNNLIYYLYCT